MKIKLAVMIMLMASNAYALDCRTVGNSRLPVDGSEIQLEVRCLPGEELLGIACNVEDLKEDSEGYGFGTPRYLGSKGRCTFFPVPQFYEQVETPEEGEFEEETYGRVYAQGKCCK